MATTCMWVVRGSLENPIDYVTQDGKVLPQNPEQEDLSDDYSPAELMRLQHIMDFRGQEQNKETLENVVGYTIQSGKTHEQRFVSGINCAEESVMEEMEAVKFQWGKTGGIVCIHAYQSFAPGEVSPELAHNIGVELAQRLWGGRFQVLVATHLDREHLHNHFVINSISYTDGRRFRCNQTEYDKMRIISDQLCKEYDLSVIERPKTGRLPNPKVYEELGIPRPEPDYKRIMKDVDTAIPCCRNMDDFYRLMRLRGYTFREGANLKYFTLRAPWADKSTRLDSREEYRADYSREGIARRIAERSAAGLEVAEVPAQWMQIPERELPQLPERQGYLRAANASYSQPGGRPIRFRGTWKPTTSFQRMYLYYCYLFGIFPKRQQRTYIPKKQRQRLRDLSDQTRLLIKNKINTMDELLTYRAGHQVVLTDLCAQRKILYNQIRYETDMEKHSHTEQQISDLSRRIKEERRQIYLCDKIQLRAERKAAYRQRKAELPQKETKNKSTKEEKQNGYGTGRSQYGNWPDFEPDP